MIHKILDWIDVPTISGVAIWISVTDLSDWLKFLSLLLAIGYTTWKWSHEYKKRNDGKN